MSVQGDITIRLALLEAKFRDDASLERVLFRIAKRTVTAADIELLTAVIRRIYFSSSLVGYLVQSQVARAAVSRFGTQYSLALAEAKAGVVPERVVDTLTEHPELVQVVKGMLAGNSVKEGFAKGQGASAQELGLDWKMWLRTVEPRTGERRAHSVLEGKIIPRDEKFSLPSGELVDAPHDWSIANPAYEWTNCGHQVLYVPSASREAVSGR